MIDTIFDIGYSHSDISVVTSNDDSSDDRRGGSGGTDIGRDGGCDDDRSRS